MPKVIFITSDGRSGSTLLDLALGQQQGVFSGGEIKTFFSPRASFERRCTCGDKFRDCVFWSEVFDRARTNGFNYPRAVDLYQTHATNRNIPRFWFNFSNEETCLEIEELSIQLGIFYEAISFVSKAEIIVDSSKTPIHGALLARCNDIEIFSVHLVRDPKAVAQSKAKLKRRGDIIDDDEYLPQSQIFKSGILWNKANIMPFLCGYTYGFRLLLRYEEFIKQPDLYLDLILETSHEHETKSTISTEEKRTIDIRGFHTASGNPMRFESSQITISKTGERPRLTWRRVLLEALVLPTRILLALAGIFSRKKLRKPPHY